MKIAARGMNNLDDKLLSDVGKDRVG